MLNDFMKLVYSKIHESLDDKNTDFIKKKAQSLGKFYVYSGIKNN